MEYIQFNPFSKEQAVPLEQDESIGDAEREFVEEFINELRINPGLRSIVIQNFYDGEGAGAETAESAEFANDGGEEGF